MSYYAIDTTSELTHHGILGMKWGVRRYQNEDGSLTSAGRIRYYGAGGDRKGYYREKGAAKRYKDVMKYHTKNYDRSFLNPIGDLKNRKAYKAWVKEDPRNRTGQRAKYELELATKELGGKKGMADAKYAYEHKRLAKYINRDGSLTTAGKLKYWDTNKARGNARMQRDIDRDKNTPTTSEKLAGKYNKSIGARILGNTAYANRSAIKGAIIGRQKDPTKYVRKNAKNIGKYALRSGLALATGRPIAAVNNAVKLAGASSIGTARAAIKTGKRITGNTARAALSGAYLTKEYGTSAGRAKQAVRTSNAMGRIYGGNTRAYNKALYSQANPYANLEIAAKRDKAILNTANKASSGVKKAAQYSYKTNKQTVQNIADTVTGKKKKKRS